MRKVTDSLKANIGSVCVCADFPAKIQAIVFVACVPA